MSLSTPQGPDHLPFVPVTAQTALEDTDSWPSCSEPSNVRDTVTNEAEIKVLKKIDGVAQCIVDAVKTTAHKKHNESNVAATIENAEPAPASGETSGKLQRDTPTSAPATDAHTEVHQAYSLIELRDFHKRAEAERAKEPEADGVNLSKVYRVPTVLVSRDEDLDTEAFRTAWEAFNKRVTHATVAFVGIDTEWEGENDPSLIQIADTEICFLFRSAPRKTLADAATTPDDATRSSIRISVERLAPLLKPVLTVSNVFLCGAEVLGDCTKLQKMGFDKIAAPLLELKNLVDAVGLQLEGGPSLVNITRAATRLDWRKDKKVTKSKWEVSELSELQLQYAADDAVAAVAVIAAVIATDVPLKDDDTLRFWVQTVAPAKPKKKGTSKGLVSKTTASCPSETSEKKKSQVQVLDKQGNHHNPLDRKTAQWYVNQKHATVTSWNGKHIAVIELCSDPPAKTNSHGEKDLAANAKDSPPPPYAGTGCDETFEAEEAPFDGAAPDVAVIPVVNAQDHSHHPCGTPAAAPRAVALPAAALSVQGTSKRVEVFDAQGKHHASFDKKKAVRHIKEGWATAIRDVEGNITAIKLLSDPQVKTKICEPWKQGRCYNGAKCTFAHGEAELVTNAKDSPPAPSSPYARTFEAEEAPFDGAAPDVAVIPVVNAQDHSHHPCTLAPSHHDGSPNELKNEAAEHDFTERRTVGGLRSSETMCHEQTV